MAATSATGAELDCVVVGGGLAGLGCAQRLARAGRSVQVLEAQETPGGRGRTVWHRGRPVDLGFQVMFRGYPRTRELVRAAGIPSRDLRPVAGGAVFVDDGRAVRLRASRLGLARFAGLSGADRARLARLGASVVGRPPESLLALDDDAGSAEDVLRDAGLSADALERVLRPLFGVMTLDRTLGIDPGYFRFLLSMLVRGPAVIPSDGLGMLAEWTSAAVRQDGGAVELGARVTALETDGDGRRVAGVRLEDGRLVSARHVVLAVEGPAARELLEPVDPLSAGRLPREYASVVNAAFALRRPLYSGRSILLNAEPGSPEVPRVDLVCQTSNITRPGAPEGPHILLATCVTTGGPAPADLVGEVGALVGRWAPRYDWQGLAEPLGVYTHPHAQFRPLAGVRRDLPGPRTAIENLILAGDATTHPSIEGAVASGVRAAEIVDALAP
jgi:phytoene dehydrogenase-like protein